jgi:aarF domain-containing kinase
LGEVARNYGIRFPRSFTLLLKQFLYFDRYIQILDPDANLFDDERITIDF